MVRASAKNHRNVLIVCNPARYNEVLSQLKQFNGADSVPIDLRRYPPWMLLSIRLLTTQQSPMNFTSVGLDDLIQ